MSNHFMAIVTKQEAMEHRRLARMYLLWGWKRDHKKWMRDAIRAWRKHARIVRKQQEQGRIAA